MRWAPPTAPATTCFARRRFCGGASVTAAAWAADPRRWWPAQAGSNGVSWRRPPTSRHSHTSPPRLGPTFERTRLRWLRSRECSGRRSWSQQGHQPGPVRRDDRRRDRRSERGFIGRHSGLGLCGGLLGLSLRWCSARPRTVRLPPPSLPMSGHAIADGQLRKHRAVCHRSRTQFGGSPFQADAAASMGPEPAPEYMRPN